MMLRPTTELPCGQVPKRHRQPRRDHLPGICLHTPLQPPSGARIMTTFDKREDGFERKFALDEEQKFKAEARRNKLLGLWVAEQLGVTGDAAAAYAKEVVASDFEEAGDADVVRKVLADLTAEGVSTSPRLLRTSSARPS
eukprot:gene8398-11377_t